MGHKKVDPLPSTSTNELHAGDQYANEREQSLLIWLNNEMEVSQSNLIKTTQRANAQSPHTKRENNKCILKIFPVKYPYIQNYPTLPKS